MKSYLRKPWLFIAVMTVLAYTGCGAKEMSAEITNGRDALYAPAVQGADADMAADADMGADADAGAEIMKMDAGEAPEAMPEAEMDAPIMNGDISMEMAAADVAGASLDFSSAADGMERSEDVIDDMMGGDFPVEPEPVPEDRVGMLTAGEWNDLKNWGFFTNLVNTGLITFPAFSIDPVQKISVTVTDPAGVPLPNVDVLLTQEEDTVLWHSVTDKNGQAYLFEMQGQTGTAITVQQGDSSSTTILSGETPEVDAQGSAIISERCCEITLETEKHLYQNTEIMFIVDTTGSMGDEMLFLQSDFAAIAEETGDENTVYSVNFYKDDGDEYVTKCSGFTGDVRAITNQLNAESASGGGDEPEAVAEILQETMSGDMWSEDAVKIAFLIYDAPPHAQKEKEDMLMQAVRDASAQGIHIVPVVSSNSSRETELFGRAIAICTNSSYVFLTDDSGIGGSHLEPIIGDYEVESLHDIIIRIIREYKQSE